MKKFYVEHQDRKNGKWTRTIKGFDTVEHAERVAQIFIKTGSYDVRVVCVEE